MSASPFRAPEVARYHGFSQHKTSYTSATMAEKAGQKTAIVVGMIDCTSGLARAGMFR